MHANVQWRHNPATGEEAPYYRLKESYRDVCGTVHSLVVLNIGFEPALVPRQMRRIAAALTSRFAHRHQKDAFGGPLEGLDPAERDYAERYWRQMITDGQIDRFDNREEQARQQEGGVRPRGLFPAHQRADLRREDHLGLLQPDTRDRVHEPPAEDRPEPAPDLPPARRPQRRPPVPRDAGLLGGEHHPPPAQGKGGERLLDGDREADVHPEAGHHDGLQRAGRESGTAAVQRAVEAGPRNLLEARLQGGSVQENEHL